MSQRRRRRRRVSWWSLRRVSAETASQGSIGQEVSVTREIFKAGDRYCEIRERVTVAVIVTRNLS